MSEKKLFFRNTRGQRLAGVLHVPKKKAERAIVMAHGFAYDKDEDGEFITAAREFCEYGFAVLRFDFEGCGESEGDFASTISDEVDDLRCAMELMKSKGYKKVGVLAASFGGVIALLASAKEGIDTLVLWNPVIYPAKMSSVESYSKDRGKIKKGIILKKGDRKAAIIKKSFVDDLKKTKPLSIAPKVKSKTIIIQGDADTHVDYRDTWELFKRIEGAKIEIIKGAEHGFHDKENSKLVTEISLGWFQEYL